MGTGTACLYACAPFTLIVSILLFMLSVMLSDGNWTFEVLAAKHKWDTAEKSRCCRNGGVIYLCISMMLWVLVLVDSFLIQLEKLPNAASKWWRQGRLPSLRELMRQRRKAAETDGAGAATDVIVMTATSIAVVRAGAARSQQHTGISVFPPPSAEAAPSSSLTMTSIPLGADDFRVKASSAGPVRGDAGCAGFAFSSPSPPAMGGALTDTAATISSATPLWSAGRACESISLGSAQAHPILRMSSNTSATASVQEVDLLMP
ncbi:hypothetical protein GH5_05392 [Leishmania sp. Ghana 2012 LV757]|uniref:Uncharacterized protein n=1 Tax=Leishmania orientalis TaxID=2249476 RepID=A0A836GQZ3_9TRYP|nr:hypothetical protein LSCM4_04687 [Leishmania orientalis]KAG5504765.1 hypothetical protein GH5_05392 [Leishmania sp. Ghana 2012 LV757]